ncbi:MAG: hypothetical protein EZS28_009567 [Streblomastix strix]|uniref:Uncharacterized protein n=1 Tax=Streblomastix strix TaxID=222440 RepID=A0A5J4WJI5_9EUKA|nr:MAG: hypothetical protein EZS28_009567 [Streblomastix strix]
MFFSLAAYLNYTIVSKPTLIPNVDYLNAFHRQIDGDFDTTHLDTKVNDAWKKLQQKLTNQFTNVLSKAEKAIEDKRIEQARIDLTKFISNRSQNTMDKDTDESLRIAVDAQTTHREDLRLPDIVLLVENTLTNAQIKTYIALTMGIAASHQKLGGQAESKFNEAWLASIAEIRSRVGAACRANFYVFKVEYERIYYFTEVSIDLFNGQKNVHPIRLLYSQAKKAYNPLKTNDTSSKKPFDIVTAP